MKGLVLLLVMLLVTHSTDARPSIVDIDLCDLCAQLDRLIPDLGGAQATGRHGSACDWNECRQSNKFELLRRNTATLFSSEKPGSFSHVPGEATMRLNVSSTHTADLIVLAFIGRHLIEHQQKSALEVPATFTYNVVKEGLYISYPVCKYEKTFYMGLLVVSVIIIILALGLRFWEQHSEVEVFVQDTSAITQHPKTHIESSDTALLQQRVPRVLSANVVRVGAMQRSDIRYRSVPQDPS